MFSQEHKYSPIVELSRGAQVDTEMDEPLSFSQKYQYRWTRRFFGLAAVLICVAAGLIGFSIGQGTMAPRVAAKDLGYLPVETIRTSFQYNFTFADRPGNESDAAWRGLFPHGGFFEHPYLDGSRATFSVYHQLHCLDGLRYGYYLHREAASQGKQLTDEAVPWDLKIHHMRHCFDLLRQALMCNADTTFEIVDEEVNGVHGFRTEHECRNWDRLWHWTATQQERNLGIAQDHDRNNHSKSGSR